MKKKIVFLIIIILLVIALQMMGFGKYLTLENLKEQAGSLKENVENNYLSAVMIFILIYIIITSSSIPGATILSLAGGYLFGALLGTIYINIGATIGATLIFLAARYLIGDWIQKKYSKQLKRFNAEVKQNGPNYLLVMRLIPLFPFFLVNMLAGLTKINLKTYVWITSLGIIPGSFVYAFAGQQLSTITSLGDILTVQMLIALLLLAALSIVPILIKKTLRSKNA